MEREGTIRSDYSDSAPPAARLHQRNSPFSDFRGEHRSEPVPPKPHRLVADLDAALVQQILNVAQRERVSNIDHHGQADDFGAGPEVPEGAALGHPARLRDRPASLNIHRADFHGEWNYTIAPSNQVYEAIVSLRTLSSFRKIGA